MIFRYKLSDQTCVGVCSQLCELSPPSHQVKIRVLLLCIKLFFSAPSPPRDITVKIVSINILEVSWRPPAVSNGLIIRYTVYLTLFGTSSEEGTGRKRRQAAQMPNVVTVVSTLIVVYYLRHSVNNTTACTEKFFFVDISWIRHIRQCDYTYYRCYIQCAGNCFHPNR